MAITSPALTLAVPALFGRIRPATDLLRRLGPTDFAADAPTVQIAPGATIKVPISSVDAAQEYNASTNNYLTGGSTDWASLTATHLLSGHDVSGVDIDSGVNQGRIEQLFSIRAGDAIAAAVQGVLKTALDGVTQSTEIVIPATGSATLADYLNIASGIAWLDRATSMLAVNGSELAAIKAVFAAQHILGTDEELARYMGFAGIVCVPGMTARAVIVPRSSVGFLARVPTTIARYRESGVETDGDTQLSIGIVVADDQGKNRLVVNGDIWFGATLLSANAAATTAGAVKIGTAA